MAQYIDKAAVVAEIEKRIKALHSTLNERETAVKIELKDFLSFIDTLEVKEVDYKPMDNDFERDAVQFCFDNGLNTTPRIAKTIAKHFFELGLRSTITEEDCKLIWNIGDEIPNMPEEEFFKELLRRYKAKKGEEV